MSKSCLCMSLHCKCQGGLLYRHDRIQAAWWKRVCMCRDRLSWPYSFHFLSTPSISFDPNSSICTLPNPFEHIEIPDWDSIPCIHHIEGTKTSFPVVSWFLGTWLVQWPLGLQRKTPGLQTEPSRSTVNAPLKKFCRVFILCLQPFILLCLLACNIDY